MIEGHIQTTWISHVDDKTVGEYFDSLGRASDGALECYMNSKCSSWTYSRRQLQSILSAFCGHYCVYFLST